MKLSPIRTLFTTSYELYRATMWHLIAFEVLPLLAMFVFGALAFGMIIADMIAASVALVLIGVVVTIVLSISASIAMVQRVAVPRPTLKLRASLEATRPLFLPYLFVIILGTLCALIGFVFFIIPGIVITVWLCFSYFTVVLEGRRGLDALKASKELVRGLWFAVFSRLVLLVLTLVAGMAIVTLIVETIFGKGDFSDMVVTIVNLVVSPFGFAYSYTLYLDVKRAKRHSSPEPEAILA